ncbi:MAG: hypothetical protein IT260_10860 [Saprospiraceae bacterium]|nr:hypothetical protein [Saprospiraceae bacterium]
MSEDVLKSKKECVAHGRIGDVGNKGEGPRHPIKPRFSSVFRAQKEKRPFSGRGEKAPL